MTTQQENYMESRLTAYREYLEAEDERWIETDVLEALEEEEKKERERLDDERPSLRGAAYKAHMKKFLKDTEKELYERFKEIYDAENEKLIDKYRRELEKEVMGEEENWYE